MSSLIKQKTIRKEVSFQGFALHTGIKSKLKVIPADSIKGIEFVRMTGSVSSYVAYFKSKKNLQNASKLFTNKYKKYWAVMSKTI